MYGIYENGEIISKFAAPMTVRSNRPTSVSDTLSLKRQVASGTAQRWEIETAVEPVSASANDFFVSLVTKGHSETLTVTMPQNSGVIAQRTSISTPAASGTAGSTTLNISNNIGIIPKGTFIQIGTDPKIYMTTNKIENNELLHIFPALRTTVNGVMSHRDLVLMQCYYDTDQVSGMVYSDGLLMDMGSIRLIEALV